MSKGSESILRYIEERSFENMANYYSDELLRIHETGRGDNLRQNERVALVRKGYVTMRRLNEYIGSSCLYELTPRAIAALKELNLLES